MHKPEVPPTTSTSTSMKTTSSVVASAGVTIATTPHPLPEAELASRVNTHLAAKSQSAAQTEYTLTSTSKAGPPVATKGPAEPSTNLVIDYSRLRIGESKPFMEAWEEASKLNEEAARLKGEELASLMALKMVHDVSSSLYSS